MDEISKQVKNVREISDDKITREKISEGKHMTVYKRQKNTILSL